MTYGGSDEEKECVTLATLANKEFNVPSQRMYSFNGKQVSGQSVEVELSNEPWAQYTLADGTTVKVKQVLLEAVRLDAHSDNGDPVYQFQFQQIVGVLAPESLKKKPH